MSRLTGSVGLLLLLLLVTLSVSSAEDEVTLRSKAQTIAAARGSSVSLSCLAVYNYQLCRLLHVTWRAEGGAEVGAAAGVELTDPKKYLTTVSETLSDGDVRHRQVETEILDLTEEDSGRYQCVARCGGAESAVGRFSEIIVKD
ncbi:uncharacterized protein zgc:174945 [Xyrichtys novacula]|uniref:Uncharacterized protein zgc:174945 n=1 Tax=Xyrichtys novacula TaxID=13765 RepID=A0AAV1FQN4_XYRNO|nr:uncharacterized protein zgc:174945 [Xyrichtys novacula]